MKKHITPTVAARMYGVRRFGSWYWFDDPDNIRRQVEQAYIAGMRHEQRKHRRNVSGR